MDITRSTYRLTSLLPKPEQFGLTSQMRRAAVSIPSNIAEGRMRGTDRDFRQFLLIALGSSAELQTQLQLVAELYTLDASAIATLAKQLDEQMKMLNRFIASLSSR